jgi:hypothetical protein
VYDVTDAGLRALKDAGPLREHVPAPSGPWVHRYMTAAITASIELATIKTESIRYIFGDEILGRAQAPLRFPVAVAGVSSNLIPDALFGLEYAIDGRKLFASSSSKRIAVPNRRPRRHRATGGRATSAPSTSTASSWGRGSTGRRCG